MGIFDLFKSSKNENSKSSQQLNDLRLFECIAFNNTEDETLNILIQKTFEDLEKKGLFYKFDELKKSAVTHEIDIYKNLKWKIIFDKEVLDLQQKFLRNQTMNLEKYKVLDNESELLQFEMCIKNKNTTLPLYLCYSMSFDGDAEESLLNEAKCDFEGKILNLYDILRMSEIYKVDVWKKCKWYNIGLDTVIKSEAVSGSKAISIKNDINGILIEEFCEGYDVDIKNVNKMFKKIQRLGIVNSEDWKRLSDECMKYNYNMNLLYVWEKVSNYRISYKSGHSILISSENFKPVNNDIAHYPHN